VCLEEFDCYEQFGAHMLRTDHFNEGDNAIPTIANANTGKDMTLRLPWTSTPRLDSQSKDSFCKYLIKVCLSFKKSNLLSQLRLQPSIPEPVSPKDSPFFAKPTLPAVPPDFLV